MKWRYFLQHENSLKLIPVIDLMQGQVVWARGGVRSRYSALSSRLCPDGDPLGLATRFAKDFGIDTRSSESLRADSPESSLTLVKQALNEPDSAAADIVSLNAGAAIYVSGVATSLANGVIMAQDAIAAGLANERLQELVRISSMMGED